MSNTTFRFATEADAELILNFIKELAKYENMEADVVATKELLIEWIFKKPVPRKIEGVIHAVGLVLLLGFSILVDVLHLF